MLNTVIDAVDIEALPIANYEQPAGIKSWYAEDPKTSYRIAIFTENPGDLKRLGSGMYEFTRVIDLSTKKAGEQYRLLTFNLELGIRPAMLKSEEIPYVVTDVDEETEWFTFRICGFRVKQLDRNFVELVATLNVNKVIRT